MDKGDTMIKIRRFFCRTDDGKAYKVKISEDDSSSQINWLIFGPLTSSIPRNDIEDDLPIMEQGHRVEGVAESFEAAKAAVEAAAEKLGYPVLSWQEE